MKKFVALILAAAAPCVAGAKLLNGNAVMASESAQIAALEKVLNDSNADITVSAKSAYLMDANTGYKIFASGENDRRPIASMTKITLLLLTFESVDRGELSLDEDIVVSENASKMGGSQVFLRNGGTYKAGDLIKSIVVASANDASVAIAERLYGSVSECVRQMNLKAESLGLKNTLYANVTGLPAPMQYSSAKDVAIIFSNLIKHEKYFDYSGIWLDKIAHTKSGEEGETEMANTNKLVRFYEGCDGGKTGFTSEAGFCLTATAKRGNMRLVSVVINAPSSKERFGDSSKMLTYGFNNFYNKAVVDKSVPLDKAVNVRGGKAATVKVAPENNFYIFSRRGDKDKVETELNLNERVSAPVLKGDVLGEIIVYNNGVEAGRVNIIATSSVEKMSYGDYIKKIAGNR